MGKRSHSDFVEPGTGKTDQGHESSKLARGIQTDGSKKVAASPADAPKPEEDDNVDLVANLSFALNAVLQSEQAILNSGTLNRVGLARCKALQLELPKPKKAPSKPKFEAQAADTLPQKPSAEITPPQNITPWTAVSIHRELPALPPILSHALKKSAFTHSGALPANAGPQDSYERLEWVGDAYIYLLSTLLISKTFPALQPGRCAQLRELCVKNETLASYARQYGFDKRCQIPKDFAAKSPQTKILGDVFEAYVAAVIYSDPINGIEKVSAWLKSLWAVTLSKEILEQDESNRAQKAGPVVATTSAKQELATQIVSRGIKLLYKDADTPGKDPVTGFPLYTVGVYLEGWGEKNKLLGRGTALGKKEAGAKAAEEALKLDLYVYKEKKRIFDEMNKAKKEAEDAAKEAAKAAKKEAKEAAKEAAKA
ncbi:hypothetical protein V490_08966 [Pseudogymnoascus sp. VKM F-3557]|nr:hypothetical protein V490_08966 [Pseudogymnoascus sp. VKM F-3557]